MTEKTDSRYIIESVIEFILTFIVIISWMVGVAFAVATKSASAITIAIVFPPYAWYLVVERILTLNQWI